jgi:thioredoxin-dependent peroxiredoxin
MSIAVGAPAPDFTLPGIENGVRRDFTLSEYRGRKVVIAFYPGDDTSVCTKQMCSYRDDFAMFEGVQAVLLGISPQDVDSHEAWAKKRNLQFPLLADTDRAVAKEYGVSAPVIGIRRSVFVIDGAGVVSYVDMKLIGATFERAKKLTGILAGI